MLPTTGLVEGAVCPICSEPIQKNIGGLYYCTNRNCPKKWRSYSLQPLPQPPPQSKEGPVLGVTTASANKALTSSQEYIGSLRQAFGYKSKREIYRLINEIPGIDVHNKLSEVLTSHDVIISFGTTGAGQLRVPFSPGTQSVTFCSGEWNQVQVLQLELELRRPHRTSGEEQVIRRKYPYGVFDFPLNVSGKPFGLACGVKS